ncbi:MAG TPA: tetratricopeptide repeat protein [Opitutaceae bacterium]|nr:tetratricopeptide repeat protein [Opitutaceae bacterium]
MKTQIIIRTFGVLVLSTATWLSAEEAAPLDRSGALAAAHAGDWERAEAVLEPLAAATPPDVEACVALALRRLEQKRHKEAVVFAERAVQVAPDSADLQALLGRTLGARIGELIFVQQGFVASRMLHAFHRAVELDPRHVPALVGLANYYLNAPAIVGGSVDKAEEYVRQIEPLAPDEAAALRARIRERRGQ